MSTLSGIASKGEKGKSKFQSLDINSLYRGESLEPHQQKSALPRKHGMQSLGKVPSARRPPANLPSLKSEHSGNDPTISLVPSGGTGWGSKPGETGQPATPAQPQPTPTPVATTPVAAPQPPVAPVVIPSVVSGAPPTVTPPAPTQGPPIPIQQTVLSDKLWSSVMASPGEGGAHPPSFLAHQSPQFQHEFPKLSSGDGQAPATGPKGGSDTQYGPGPSLRPQTEGSWIQGGGRTAGQPPGGPLPAGAGGVAGTAAAPAPGPLPLAHLPPGADPAGGRSNLGPCVAQQGAMGPGGPGTPAPSTGATSGLPGAVPPPPANMMGHMPPNAGAHQFRGIIPQFIYRGFPPNFQNIPNTLRPRLQYQTENRFNNASRPVNAPVNPDEEIVPRPIIKEEELSKMDDIARDAGWATHDDDIIDYNQKLLFSDDEGTQDEDVRKDPRNQSHTTKEDKRSVERERDRDTSSTDRERDRDRERDEHRVLGTNSAVQQKDDLREKRSEPLPSRVPPDQRSWQQGRPPLNMEFRNPPPHGPVPTSVHGGSAPINCPMPAMRPTPHQVVQFRHNLHSTMLS